MPRTNKTLSRCTICLKKPYVNSKVVRCLHCSSIVHLKCVNPKRASLSANEYQHQHSKDDYLCIRCLEDTLPFMSLDENEFNLAILSCNTVLVHFGT